MSTAKALIITLTALFASIEAQADQLSDYVILNFSAHWCQPCKEMRPAIEQLSEQGWLIRQVDAEREKELIQRWQVTQLPTLVILKNGREVDRITGQLSLTDLAQRLPTSVKSSTGLATKMPPVSQTAATTSGPASPPLIDPMQATVRIKIEDGQSTSFGSGTIIDQHGDEALILTCGHLFRDLHQHASLSVDVPIAGQLVSMPASVIDFRCDETDIGLIAFRPGRAVAVAPLLPRGVTLKEQETVSSFGCDHGAEPTRRDSYISKLNRYVGPTNVEVARAPVQGRSGGGLFNHRGQLIGVCYAADAELDEGLYSGPEVVYQQLARLGLARLYHPAPNLDPIVSNEPHPIPASTPTHIPRPVAGIASDEAFPDQSMGDGWKSAIDQAAKRARDVAAQSIASVTRQANGATLTAIIRDADGTEKQITIPSPSPALLQALHAQAGGDSQMAIR